MRDTLLDLIWLSQTLDPESAWSVYHYFGSATAAYDATEADYRALPFLMPHQVAFLGQKSQKKAETILAQCEKLGIGVLTYEDDQYPATLRGIESPPLVLYTRGQLPNFATDFAAAMAGTRKSSDYGTKTARRLARDLVRDGIIVVTGVAEGCDRSALEGALESGGPVGAVVIGGLDVPFYPTEDCKQLYDRVAAQGFLISEYPPGVQPAGGQFHYRNRILTGLCHCVVCVEGARHSGTIQVANLASEQGREVFAVPASLDSYLGSGMNELIHAHRAVVLLSSEDVLEFAHSYSPWLPLLPEIPEDQENQDAQKVAFPPETADPDPDQPPAEGKISAPIPTKLQKKVDSVPASAYIDLENLRAASTKAEFLCCLVLAEQDATADEIAVRCQMPVVTINSALTILSVRQLVQENSNGFFSLLVNIDPNQAKQHFSSVMEEGL
jgi:DNA processing protein